MQILDKLNSMSEEEGIKLMKQLFNPLRGRHVTFREVDRDKADKVVKNECHKVEAKDDRRTP